MIQLLAGMLVLFTIAVVVAASRDLERIPLARLGLAGLAFTIALIMLEMGTRIVGYDIVRGNIPMRSYDGPVMAGIGIIMLIELGAALIAFIVGLVLTITAWRKAKPPAWILLASLLPVAAVLLVQHSAFVAEKAEVQQQVVEKSRQDTLNGEEWSRKNNIRQESGCRSDSAAFLEGCRKHLQSLASAGERFVSSAGKSWASKHEIFSRDGCDASSEPDFYPHAVFIAGCKQGVADLLRSNGEYWAEARKLMKADECRPGGEGFRDEPEFVAGCRENVVAMRKSAGQNWVLLHYVFDAAECRRSGLLDVGRDADFIASCESAVLKMLPITAFELGRRWVYEKRPRAIEDCELRGAPERFAEGCRLEFVELHRSRK